MTRMGWHYGPCKPAKTGGMALLIVVIIGAVEAHQHAKGIEEIIRGTLIIAEVMVVMALALIITAIRRELKPAKHRTITQVREGITMDIPDGTDAKAAFRAWLKLTPAQQCSKEWDWLTNLTDENRAQCQAELEGRVIVSKGTKGDKQ